MFCRRTGVAAVLLLTALGVPRDQVLRDFMETARSAEMLAQVPDSIAAGNQQRDESVHLDQNGKIHRVDPEFAS